MGAISKKLIFFLIALSSTAYAANGPKCYLPKDGDEAAQKAAGAQVIQQWTTQLPPEISEEELAARLVYAETLATNCGPQYSSQNISKGISWVIRNRVDSAKASAAKARRFGSGIHGVVFQKSQFNSSLSTNYSLSQWKEFLCPTKMDVWQSALKETQATFADDAKNPFADSAVTSVYYYHHFDSKPVDKRPPPPKWAEPKSTSRVQLPGAAKNFDDCIGFFSEGSARPPTNGKSSGQSN